MVALCSILCCNPSQQLVHGNGKVLTGFICYLPLNYVVII